MAKALERLNGRQSNWTRAHLFAAIDAEMPPNLPDGMTIDRYEQLLLTGPTRGGLVRSGIVCLTPEQVIDQDVPRQMADENGLSWYLPRGLETYVAAEVLEAESAFLTEALRMTAPSVTREKAQAIAGSAGLVDDQAEGLAGILSSGRNLEVLLGPAGTGKSYTLAQLEPAWQRVCRQRGAVVALTVSQNAAEVLKAEGFKKAMNLARWFQAQERIAAGRGLKEDQAYFLQPGQLVVVDEASMASTADIAQVVEMVQPYGGKVLLTGDHRQLAAVEQGGALGLLAEDPLLRQAGAIHELSTVRR